jgi:hypothetical protein
MHFDTKSYLKSIRNHTVKHLFCFREQTHFILILMLCESSYVSILDIKT